jgi:hypothetical protein
MLTLNVTNRIIMKITVWLIPTRQRFNNCLLKKFNYTFSWRPALNGKQLLVKSLAYAFVKRISLLIPKQAIARSKSFYFKADANAK